MSEALPETIAGRYEVQELLGQGGMGRVYKARDLTLGRDVAIKVLLGRFAVKNVSRFQREAKNMSNLQHINLVTVYDFGITGDGTAYLVMEYATGTLLSDLLKQRKVIGVQDTIALGLAIATGMRHAHEKGVIHRDLKPANVLIAEVEKLDRLKVFDFGISKAIHDETELMALTQTGSMIGTPFYMSPEQARGGPVDARSDVYSLGCLLYQCLCGKPPLAGSTAFDTVQMQINQPPPPLKEAYPELGVPDALDRLIMKTLAKNPGDRVESMQELVGELQRCHAALHGPESEGSSGLPGRLRQLAARDKAVLAAALGGFCCAVVVALFALGAPRTARSTSPTVIPGSTSEALWAGYFTEEKGGRFRLKPNPYDVRDASVVLGQMIPVRVIRSLPSQRVNQIWIERDSRLPDEFAKIVSKFPFVTELRLTDSQFTGEKVTGLSGMENLEYLTIKSARLTDSDMRQLVNLPRLKSLDLEKTGVTDDIIAILAENYPGLEKLRLGRTMMTGSRLEDISRLPRLKRLAINHLDIPDRFLGRLRGSMESLDISGNQIITENGIFQALTGCPNLTELIMQGTSLDPGKQSEFFEVLKKRAISIDNKRRNYNQRQKLYTEEAKKNPGLESISDFLGE